MLREIEKIFCFVEKTCGNIRGKGINNLYFYAMFKQIGTAIKAYNQAAHFVFRQGLYRYFIYPVIICILLFIGGTALISEFTNYLNKELVEYLNIDAAGSETMSVISDILKVVLFVGLKIIFFFVGAAIMKYLVLIIMSPVMAMLSQRIDELITGKKYPFNLGQFIKDILRGSLIALRNMLIQFALIAICFMLMPIPVLGWIMPLFLLVINYYFYGFSMMDYTSERNKMGIIQSIRFIRRNKGLAIGNGFIFALLFAIPFIGVIIAPILGVAAGTIVAMEAHKESAEWKK